MQPGLSEVAAEVDSDPGAVFEAHDAETVQELVASGGSGTADRTASVRALARLFEGDLDRPERREVATPEEDAGGESAGASGSPPAMLGDIDGGIEPDEPEAAQDAVESLEDGPVADALAAAEDLEDGELPASVPEEWLEEP